MSEDTDHCEAKVISKIMQRRRLGLSKYGHSVDTNPLSKVEWLTHAQEEALDLAIYLEKLIALEEK